MSQRDNFAGGFFLGAIVGGAIGGVVGALLASRAYESGEATDDTALNPAPKRHRLLKAPNGTVDMEGARRSLEDKIAQLNDAIDDVREQLGTVEPSPLRGAHEHSSVQEP